MCKVCSSLGQKWGNERAITGSNIILTSPTLHKQSDCSTRLMNGKSVGTRAFMTTAQEFEVEKYSLVQEIFVKYSNWSRNFS